MTKLFQQYPNLTSFLGVDEKTIPESTPPFLEHLFGKIDYHISQSGRILILTLTKKSAEEIAQFFISKGYKTYYLHSEISTIDRREIVKKLRS
jgi:excinuclease ABC subunit B